MKAVVLSSRLLLVFLTASGWIGLGPGAEAQVRASRGSIVLPTYPWAAVAHPYFRGTDGKNIYPYPMLDFLSRERTNRTYEAVVLENELLRLTFLPQLGGKLHEAIDKAVGKPMFYVNHVVKPGLIGQCGAWTSGGVEWNTGPQGHTVSAMQPVDVVILRRAEDGSQSVAIGEKEGIYGTKWTVVVTLRPNRSFIEERIRIYNATDSIRPYYFWNCTAMPNTPGFRFIYPMTLGTDHGGEKFFQWPIHEGKDLTRGRSYHDAASIFAYGCDQDFFGSYLEDEDRGVVSVANHHQLPGKKAWTWGQGGFGKMHQMDLTDADGPYNEVQTGPLLTQSEVGRLGPYEAVEWMEWWYPIHGLGGLTFANREAAVHAWLEGGKLHVRFMGTGTNLVYTEVRKPGERMPLMLEPLMVGVPASAVKASEARYVVGDYAGPFEIRVWSYDRVDAEFKFPLDLPRRTPPAKPTRPETSAELARAGWQEYLFARYAEAERRFRSALEKDRENVEALYGLAQVNLDRAPLQAAGFARAALAVDADCGGARYVLAVAEFRLGNEVAALEEAWKAALDPGVAVAGRGLAARLLLRQGKNREVVEALSGAGPWESDPTCLGLLALAWGSLNDVEKSREAAEGALEIDPLDLLGLYVNRGSNVGGEDGQWFQGMLTRNENRGLVELMCDLAELKQERRMQELYARVYRNAAWPTPANPLPVYLAGERVSSHRRLAPSPYHWPYRLELEGALRRAIEKNPADSQAVLYLGHLLFQMGRHNEGRVMWKRATELGAYSVVAYRALGMAAKTLDGDLSAARLWLERANQADAGDAIVARDLAAIILEKSEKAGSAEEKREGLARVRDCLKAAFESGKGRSDFVVLLARALNGLGEYGETARMLDSVRVTVWEGAREVHDLFEAAHLALGEAQLAANQFAEALAEFNRALEYPTNLATGKLEQAREAHIHLLRGRALAGLGRKDEALAAYRLAASEPPSNNPRIEKAQHSAREAIERETGRK